VPAHLLGTEGEASAEVCEHRRFKILREPTREVRGEVDDVFTIPLERCEVGVRDHRTIRGCILHVQPVDAVGDIPVKREGHTGCTLVGYRGDIHASDLGGHLGGECRYDGVIILSIDEPPVGTSPDLPHRGVEHNRGTQPLDLFLEPGDEVVKPSPDVAQTLTPGATVRSDRNPGYEPGGRDLAPAIPELALQERFEE
jgi:hypothetical protein